MRSYQTPPDNGVVVDLGGKLFRKRVLPYRSISYQGGKLSIDRHTAERIVESFKRGAHELVPFVLGGHSDDPARTGGRVQSLSAEEDGLYATIETNDAGEEAIRRNFHSLPVSVRYVADHVRESDGARFGPTLAHVASTFSPRMVGMGGWVEASAAPTEHIDLSESSWEGSPRSAEAGVDASKRAELERQFGLPLTRLSEEEWSRVKTAAAKTASEKLHIPFSKAASHYEAFVPEGYAEAITRKEGTSKGAKGAPGKKTTNPTLADESWMRPGIVDLSESSAEDRDFIRRAEAYAFEHCMSWNEATRYVTR